MKIPTTITQAVIFIRKNSAHLTFSIYYCNLIENYSSMFYNLILHESVGTKHKINFTTELYSGILYAYFFY